MVSRYDKPVHIRGQAEEEDDFVTMNPLATLSGTHPIKKVVGERYTRLMFKKFQVEFLANNNCMHETLTKIMAAAGTRWFV